MTLLCKVMQVSRSGYYRYCKALVSERAKDDIQLITELKALAKISKNSYGNRQMTKNLQAKGYEVGRYKVRRLMKQAGIVCKQRKVFRVTTDSNHSLPVAGNVLNREFTVSAPNHVWVTDITYLHTLEGWLYVAAVLDLFSRRIVGWAMESHMRGSLVHDALMMALQRRQPDEGLLHHSDQGKQYVSGDYQQLLAGANIRVSMSRKANCWDNAVMERFWGSLKSERTDGCIYRTRDIAKADVIDYIEMFYNCKRLHSTLGYLSPAQFESRFS